MGPDSGAARIQQGPAAPEQTRADGTRLSRPSLELREIS
jgi:hypothetical protein